MTRYLSVCTDCGWQSHPANSQAMADRAYRSHSCARQRRRDAAKLRRMRRRARIDRTPKPCVHKFANHQHGTHACYVLDKCRCRPCARANSQYERQLSRRNAYGRSNLVSAKPSRQHARGLMGAGMGLKRIAAISGVPQGALWKLLYGKRQPDGTQVPSRRVTKATEQRLLAIDQPVLAGGAMVDAAGAARRLQALVACGWSVGQLAARSGQDRQALDALLRGRTTLRVSTDHTIRALYQDLWDTPPPEGNQREKIAATRSRKRAAAAGWKPLGQPRGREVA
jgi:hypothetical protein